MIQLYHRLQAVGLSKSYVKERLLPDWWDDEIAFNDTGYAEALGYLSRFAALDLRSLLNNSSQPLFNTLPDCKYKKSKNTREDELSLARAIATRIAQLVIPGDDAPIQTIPNTARQIRNEILGRGERWVNLSNLLDYCWASRIPVVHLAELPTGKKPHGLTANFDGHTAIVICKQDKYSAWLLFILAHEIGHVALGHIKNNEVLLDEDVKELGDEDEKQADLFAIELLTGDSERRYTPRGSRLRFARRESSTDQPRGSNRKPQVDPARSIYRFGIVAKCRTIS